MNEEQMADKELELALQKAKEDNDAQISREYNIFDVVPRYEHDCDNCRFLGQFANFDIWICEHLKTDTWSHITIICRESSDGPDYASNSFRLSQWQEAIINTPRFWFHKEDGSEDREKINQSKELHAACLLIFNSLYCTLAHSIADKIYVKKENNI